MSPHIICTLPAIRHDQRSPWSMLTRTHTDTALTITTACISIDVPMAATHLSILYFDWTPWILTSHHILVYLLLATIGGALDRPSTYYHLSTCVPCGLAQQENASFWCCPFISFARNKQMNWVSTRSNVPPKSCTWRGSNGGPWR